MWGNQVKVQAEQKKALKGKDEWWTRCCTLSKYDQNDLSTKLANILSVTIFQLSWDSLE